MAAPLHEEALDGFILIRTDEVDSADRLRPIDTVWAEALGQMMARDGQDTAIQVCRLPGKIGGRWLLARTVLLARARPESSTSRLRSSALIVTIGGFAKSVRTFGAPT